MQYKLKGYGLSRAICGMGPCSSIKNYTEILRKHKGNHIKPKRNLHWIWLDLTGITFKIVILSLNWKTMACQGLFVEFALLTKLGVTL